MKNIPSVVDTYFVALILGISQRSAQKKLREIKKAYKKMGSQKHVSLSEFVRYTGIPMKDILRTLGIDPVK